MRTSVTEKVWSVLCQMKGEDAGWKPALQNARSRWVEAGVTKGGLCGGGREFADVHFDAGAQSFTGRRQDSFNNMTPPGWRRYKITTKGVQNRY